MEEKLELLVRHGTGEERIEVSADEVLNSIAEGRDVDIEYALIIRTINRKAMSESNMN